MVRPIVLSVVLLVAVSGCLSPAEDQALEEDSTDGEATDNRTSDDEATDEGDGESTGDEGQTDLDWQASIQYDYVRGSGSTGTAQADVPEEASRITVTAQFAPWPPVGPAPGICSTDSELLIEIETPDDEPRLNHTFTGTLEPGTGGGSCTQVEAFSQEDPAPGEWTVSFLGEGIAVGKVVFEGS